ncbi:MAG: hypothetical protein IT293_10900 [Deltaproteobacteria bacterium]|nr:hypothetical protein [Deltaproteobacteria bacterium]
MTPLVAALVLAFALTVALTPLVRRLATACGATDQPGARRVHVRPIARAGGIGIAIATGTALLVTESAPAALGREVWMAAGLLVVVGLVDDVRALPAGLKLLAQIVAAALTVHAGLRFTLFAWAAGAGLRGFDPVLLDAALTIGWIVFATNALNLSDGLDGLTSGLGVIALGWLGATALRFGDIDAAVLPLVLGAALLGFLVYNYHPASIFLGDTGSLLIGYALAVLPLAGKHRDVIGPLSAFLLIAVPATDTLLAMARRFLARCLPAWGDGAFGAGVVEGLRNTVRPDRRHIHHRLLDLGFGQRRAVAWLHGGALVTGGLAFAAADNPVWPADVLALGLGIVVIGLVQALGIDELRPARNGLILPVLSRLARRRWLIVAADGVLVLLAQGAALALGGHPVLSRTSAAVSLAAVTLVHLATFRALGVYRTVWWASTGANDLAVLGRACAAATCASYVLLRLVGVPATPVAAVVRFLFLLPVLAAVRFSPVLLADAVRRAGRAERAVICGTAVEAQHAITHLRRNGMGNVEPVGFVETLPRLQGRQLGRLPVLGTLDGLSSILRAQSVGHVVIADPELRGEALRWARAVCRHSGVRLHRYIERLLQETDAADPTGRRGPLSVMAATGTEGHSR